MVGGKPKFVQINRG